jgi:nicotinate dehydrogenase subunit A
MTTSLKVNGKVQTVETDPSSALLYALRNDCDINSAKYGCGLGQCGSCMVIINGNAVRSCITPINSVNSNVTTLESYETDRVLKALNKAFIAEQAVQCGFCISGMMMSAKVLLDNNKRPTEQQIKVALNGNLCRCGTHTRILKAIQRAAKELA